MLPPLTVEPVESGNEEILPDLLYNTVHKLALTTQPVTRNLYLHYPLVKNERDKTDYGNTNWSITHIWSPIET